MMTIDGGFGPGYQTAGSNEAVPAVTADAVPAVTAEAVPAVTAGSAAGSFVWTVDSAVQVEHWLGFD
jgi:hypothetical protein